MTKPPIRKPPKIRSRKKLTSAAKKDAASKVERKTASKHAPIDDLSDTQNDAFEVGYGKPPIQTQFKKGMSGNPKGRPKGAKNFSTIAREELSRTLPLTENGRRRKMSVMQIAMRKTTQEAIAGNHNALKQLFALAERYSNEANALASESTLTKSEEDLLVQFVDPPRQYDETDKT